VVYAVQIDDDLWVVHAFQKKSKKASGRRHRRSRPSSGG
jgi:phage-related protein